MVFTRMGTTLFGGSAGSRKSTGSGGSGKTASMCQVVPLGETDGGGEPSCFSSEDVHYTMLCMATVGLEELDNFLQSLGEEERRACAVFCRATRKNMPQKRPSAESGETAGTARPAAFGSFLDRQADYTAQAFEDALARAVAKVLEGVGTEMSQLRSGLGQSMRELQQGMAELANASGLAVGAGAGKEAPPPAATASNTSEKQDSFAVLVPEVPKKTEEGKQPAAAPEAAASGAHPLGLASEEEEGKCSLERRPSPKPTILTKISRGSFVMDTEAQPSHDYEIAEKIGEGTFGTVHICLHKELKLKRAMKTILKSSLDEVTFQREIDIMTGLDHPNILRLYAVYHDDESMHLVTDLCTGGELFDAILSKETGFTERIGAKLMKQMLMAVGYLHAKHICHRDLKPENFLLSQKDVDIEQVHVKLIDFGTAKSFANGSQLLTKVCTVHYVAPEVLSTKEVAYTELCDIWSLGVIMYLLLSGHPPFSADSDREVMRLIKKGKYTLQPQEAWDKVSDDAKDLLQKMLCKSVPQRICSTQAAHHVWIRELAPAATNEALLNGNIVRALKDFLSNNRLKKFALQMVAHNLADDEHLGDMRDAFVALDADNSGTLEIKEIVQILESSGLEADVIADMHKVLSEMQDKSTAATEINYMEFLGATVDQAEVCKEETLWRVFHALDLDADGILTSKDVQEALTKQGNLHGIDVDLAEVKAIMLEADTDGDGAISFPEFKEMMQRGSK
eukprot:TRINITY_DN8698_c0_g1_i1.p1 TRINITY_DN8698_c0_g1~~TRINITY_DN8698_c0_g1_i1.p1  ORF type:complete len:737 (-),score=223.69 TRINITY_DN8698_c0_g1_i1:139-2349(-)